jgi:putative ABC transport system permease protein
MMLAQSTGDPSTLAGPMRELVGQLDGDLPISAVRTKEALYEMRAVRIFKVLITLIGGMGLMGLGLSIVGLYGLVAFTVSRRTREIGIRMAVGADRATVLRLVLRQGLALSLAGLAVGVTASVVAGELLKAAFPGGADQRSIVGLLLVVPIVLAVTGLAAYVPARQAARVDPILALRHE